MKALLALAAAGCWVAEAGAVTDSSGKEAGPPAAQLPSDSTGSALDEYFVLESRHRVFSGFRQVDTVRVGQLFSIGEGEEQGEVYVFNPHLSITEKGQILQLSDTLYNPAVRVRVTLGDSLVQESWAFYYTSAPHFRRSDLLGFRLLDFRVSDRFVRVDGPKPITPPAPTDSIAKSH
jgi:hypothetical protein